MCIIPIYNVQLVRFHLTKARIAITINLITRILLNLVLQQAEFYGLRTIRYVRIPEVQRCIATIIKHTVTRSLSRRVCVFYVSGSHGISEALYEHFLSFGWLCFMALSTVGGNENMFLLYNVIECCHTPGYTCYTITRLYLLYGL